MLRQIIDNYGIPVSIYADRHIIFRSPNEDKADVDSNLSFNDTQFGRALKELCVELIPARSPQAKGRIERLWGTLQSRLPVEFELNGIDCIDSANEFLKTYIYAFNSQFAVEPEDSESLFMPADNSVNLDYILCVKEERSVDAGGVFTYRGKQFKLPYNEYTKNIHASTRITVLSSPSFGVMAQYKGIALEVLPFVPPKRRKKVPETKERIWNPQAEDHPWKGDVIALPRIESDHEIVNMLEDIFLTAY